MINPAKTSQTKTVAICLGHKAGESGGAVITNNMMNLDEQKQTMQDALNLFENGSFTAARNEIYDLVKVGACISELEEEIGEESSDPIDFARFVGDSLFRCLASPVGKSINS